LLSSPSGGEIAADHSAHAFLWQWVCMITRIALHLACLTRKPSRWRFFAAGIARELRLA